MGKEMQYYLADINDFILYIRNARTHSQSQIAQIAASIKEFGFLSPILIAEDNTILAGDDRLAAARKLGLKQVPCVKESHLTETQRRAYIISDNKLSLMQAGMKIYLRLNFLNYKEQILIQTFYVLMKVNLSIFLKMIKKQNMMILMLKKNEINHAFLRQVIFGHLVCIYLSVVTRQKKKLTSV